MKKIKTKKCTLCLKIFDIDAFKKGKKIINTCKTCKNKSARSKYDLNKSNPASIARNIVKRAKQRLKEKKAKIILETTGMVIASSNLDLSADDFDITPEWCLEQRDKQLNRCTYSGLEMIWAIGYMADGLSLRLNPYVVSIDRVDSTKGYTKDNCVLVCWKVNAFKSDGNAQELLEFSMAIVDNLSKKYDEIL